MVLCVPSGPSLLDRTSFEHSFDFVLGGDHGIAWYPVWLYRSDMHKVSRQDPQ